MKERKFGGWNLNYMTPHLMSDLTTWTRHILFCMGMTRFQSFQIIYTIIRLFKWNFCSPCMDSNTRTVENWPSNSVQWIPISTTVQLKSHRIERYQVAIQNWISLPVQAVQAARASGRTKMPIMEMIEIRTLNEQ